MQASTTRVTIEIDRWNESATNALIPAVSTARERVTQSAGSDLPMRRRHRTTDEQAVVPQPAASPADPPGSVQTHRYGESGEQPDRGGRADQCLEPTWRASRSLIVADSIVIEKSRADRETGSSLTPVEPRAARAVVVCGAWRSRRGQIASPDSTGSVDSPRCSWW